MHARPSAPFAGGLAIISPCTISSFCAISFCAILFSAIGLAGCHLLPRRDSTGSNAPADPGGTIVIDATPPVGRIPLLITRRTEIPISIRGDRTYDLHILEPGRTEWARIDPDPALGHHLVRLEHEGVHRLRTAIPGGAPPKDFTPDSLQIRLDVTPPSVQVRRQRIAPASDFPAGGLSFEWRVLEEVAHGGPPALAYSPNRGREWRPILCRSEEEGELRWPFPPEPVGDHFIRIEARDLAGNRAELSLPLWSEERQGAWIGRAAPEPAALAKGTLKRGTEAGTTKAAAHTDELPELSAIAAGLPADRKPRGEVAPRTDSVTSPAERTAPFPTPLVRGPEQVTATPVESGPEPRFLNFAGETFRGGSQHYLFLKDSGVARDSSDLEVRMVPMASNATVASRKLPAGADRVLWEFPAASARYQLEARWEDARGRARTSPASDPVTVDADAPLVGWGEVPPACATTLIAPIEVRGEPADQIAAWRLFRRVPGETAWTRIEAGPEAYRCVAEQLMHATLDVASWPEAEYELAVIAEDSCGNRTPSPLLGPIVRVDRTPPAIAEFEVGRAQVEGIPLVCRWRSPEAPPAVRVEWSAHAVEAVFPRAGGALVWRAAPDERDGHFAHFGPFGPGKGDLSITLEDRAGNRSTLRAPIEVAEAVLELALASDPPFAPAAILEVEVKLAAPYPDSERSLALELLCAGEVLERAAISGRESRVRLPAPATCGDFELAVRVEGSPVPFARRATFRIEEPARAGAASPAAEALPAAASAEAAADAELLRRVHALGSAWLGGERGMAIEEERVRLASLLDERLAHAPANTRLRRARAQLLVHRDPPDLDRAARILSEAATDAATDPGEPLAEVLNDLAAVELRRGRIAEAEGHLLKAIAIGDTPLRRHNLGEVLLRARRHADAERSYRRAVEGDPARAAYKQAWARCVGHLQGDARSEGERTLARWVAAGIVLPGELGFDDREQELGVPSGR